MRYDFKNVSVLIVDDNHPMLTLLKAMLTKFGVGKIIIASNGAIAFNKFCNHNPDIVISDWMMDRKDGMDLADMIRNDPSSPNPFVPFILMTGFSEEHRVVTARDVGITEFLLKPFSALDLYKRIAVLIESPRQFVRSEDFFGPDRRRRRDDDFTGKRKRKADPPQHDKQKDQDNAQQHIDEIKKEQGVDHSDDILLQDTVVNVDMIDRDSEPDKNDK